MFSARFAAADHQPSPLWQALQAARARGAEVLDLTLSNPTAAGIPYPANLPSLLDRPEVLRYRPDPRGLPAARAAVAAYLNGLEASPGIRREARAEDILLTASTSEAYAYLFKLLCDPGDEVLIPTPTNPLFDALAELEHVDLVRYPLRRRPSDPGSAVSWRPDFATLRNLVSTRTKALILVSPNNPTGHVAAREESDFCRELAREHDLALIVDEVFREYLFSGGPYHAPGAGGGDEGPLVFTLNGLSKLAGLPQLKLGWIHAEGPRDRVAAALEHLEWIADAYLSVNSPVQEACRDILALAGSLRGPIRARLEANLSHARGPAGGNPTVTPLLPEGGWSLVLEIASRAGEEAFALSLLRERGVHVHPGDLFGFPAAAGRIHLVVSLLVPEAEFRAGYARILAHAEAHAGG
jgi:alanine-synthesizing transaminase